MDTSGSRPGISVDLDALSPLAARAAFTARALVGARLEAAPDQEGKRDYSAVASLLGDTIGELLPPVGLNDAGITRDIITQLGALLLAQATLTDIAISLVSLETGIAPNEILAEISDVADRSGFTF